jgi:hypothetical protein
MLIGAKILHARLAAGAKWSSFFQEPGGFRIQNQQRNHAYKLPRKTGKRRINRLSIRHPAPGNHNRRNVSRQLLKYKYRANILRIIFRNRAAVADTGTLFLKSSTPVETNK